jgi:telomerase reverse transcriptase
MSASFPSIPGFIGPLSLKAFLEDFFLLRLTFGSSKKCAAPTRLAGSSSQRVLQEVLLPINETFLVVVYVARHAPVAPVPAVRVPQHQNDKRSWVCDRVSSTRDLKLTRGIPTHFTCDTSQSCSPLGAAVQAGNRFPSSVQSRAGIQRNDAAPTTDPWLLYTQVVNRPLTRALLQHPWWMSLASLLGPAATAFMELYCPVVLQLEAMAGGVQVLGPALHPSAPIDARTTAMRRRWCAMKRARDDETTALLTGECRSHQQKARRVERRGGVTAAGLPPRAYQQQKSVCGVCPRNTKGKSGGQRKKKEAAPSPKAASTWAATLPRTDLPRTRLYNVSAKEEDSADVIAGSEGIDGRCVRPLPASLLEALWLAHHPRSLQCTVRAALPRWQTSRLQRTSPCSAGVDSLPPTDGGGVPTTTAPLCLPLCHVRHVFRWMELKLFTDHDARANTDATGTSNGFFDVSAHLQRVLSTVLDQCSRLDLRGAALKHLRYLEDRFQRQQQAQEPSDIRRLAAPVDVVVGYLRTLLSTLRWPLTAHSDCTVSPSSFWGAEEASSTRVMDALCAAMRAWLSAGRHAAFPVSRFLDGLPVAQLPWLSGFFTTCTSRSPSSVRNARCKRSQIQQRVWLQFVLFLTQDIIPFLVRASFAVTWTSKNTNQLFFYPASVWRRVMRAELRRAVSLKVGHAASSGAEGEREPQGSEPSCLRVASSHGGTMPGGRADLRATRRLCPFSAADAVACRDGAAASLTAGNGKPFLLYAGVRFRPDGRKLRPIAVLRSASPRSIKKIADGTPSPYSHPAATLQLLMKVVTWTGVALSLSASQMLAWVQRYPNTHKGRHVLALQHQQQGFHLAPPPPLLRRRPPPPPLNPPPHKKAMREAFQCLVSGAEEQRVRSGLPKLSNLTHQEEYAELRSFCEETRHRVVESKQGSEESEDNQHTVTTTATITTATGEGMEAASARVFLVRSDASRCYDNLPQVRVLQEAHALVHHDAYRTLSFTTIFSIADGPCCSVASLRSTQVTRTIPCEDVARGKLARIPRGHIYWETESKDTKTAVLSGTAVRALLQEHLQRHLVVLEGGIFEQCVGILQGSPVAMLLCDQLFSNTIDASLSHILSEHTERSMLLRRVDDVLVATTSPVAAQRCLQAMRCGWPSVGYESNTKKLTMSSASTDASGFVPWCGLLLHDTTLETSVEWRRMRPLLPSVWVADTRVVYRGDREPLLFTQRLLAILQLRIPPTVLCSRMNSKRRQLQTFCEAALVWCRLIVWKVQETLFTAHHRCVTVLLLRPLAVCVDRLCRLLRRHQAFLMARQSNCAVGRGEVRACVLTALHRTLQAKLRVLVLHTARCTAKSRLQQQRHQRLSGFVEKTERRAATTTKRGLKPDVSSRCSITPRFEDEVSLRGQSKLRAFWWCAAFQIASQWRSALAALERVDQQKAVEKAWDDTRSSTIATANLLRDAGPSSLFRQALQATQQLFHPDANESTVVH